VLKGSKKKEIGVPKQHQQLTSAATALATWTAATASATWTAATAAEMKKLSEKRKIYGFDRGCISSSTGKPRDSQSLPLYLDYFFYHKHILKSVQSTNNICIQSCLEIRGLISLLIV